MRRPASVARNDAIEIGRNASERRIGGDRRVREQAKVNLRGPGHSMTGNRKLVRTWPEFAKAHPIRGGTESTGRRERHDRFGEAHLRPA